MLAETVYLFLGDPAKVAESNGGLCPRRPRRHDFRGAEHSTLGQDAHMGMTVILPHRQACSLHCIACSDALQFIGFFAKEPIKRDDVVHKSPIILMSLLIVATP